MISRILLVALTMFSAVALLLPPAMAHQPTVIVGGTVTLGSDTLSLDASAMTMGQNLTGKAVISLTGPQLVKSYASLGGFVSGSSIFLVGLVTKSDNPALVNAVVEITANASTGSVLFYFEFVVQNVSLQNTTVILKG